MNVIKRKVIPISLTVIILLTCLIIPAFASSYQKFTSNDLVNSTDVSIQYNLGTSTYNGANIGFHVYLNDNITVKFMYTRNNAGNDCMIFYSDSDQFTAGIDKDMSDTIGPDAHPILDTNTNYYYVYQNQFSISDPYWDYYGVSIPVFNCEGFSYTTSELIRIAEINSSSPVPFNYSIPAGNVAYIELGAHFTSFYLKSLMQAPSRVVGDQPWINVNQYWGFADSLPTSGEYTPIGTAIDWQKDGSLNLLGQTNNAIFEPVGPFQQSKYLVIYNPYYNGDSNINSQYANGSISVYLDDAQSIKVFPITASLGSTGYNTIDINSNITDSDYYDGEIDPESGDITWSDPTGDISTGPQTGGGNNIDGNGKTVIEIIEKLAENISSFFTGSVTAIGTLVSCLSNFVYSLKSLYMWLPGPVYSLLTSAIMIALTIGVIKIFI